MFRLGLGAIIGWLAYEAFQKDKDKMSDTVKSCVAKAVDTIKNAQLTDKKEEGEDKCTTTK